MIFPIGIEGNIGVGKSYFLTVIKKYLSSQLTVIEEPLNYHQDLLTKYYEDPYLYAFPFQLAMLSRRAHIYYKIMKKQTGIFLIERTIQSDYNIFAKLVFNKGYMSKNLFESYKKVYLDLTAFIVPPKRYIYLRGNKKFLLQRIKQRNREGESAITYEYLQEIEQLYDDWLLNREKDKVTVINISKDLTDKEIVSLIQSIIQNKI